MELFREYPFNNFTLPDGEQVVWFGCNPTFHRGHDYGIVLTNQAVYLRSWVFSIVRGWRRIALHEIRKATFKDSPFFPCLQIQLVNRTIRFRTPHDWYKDEMNFDRDKLVHAACFIEHMRAAPNNSFKPTPLRGVVIISRY